MAFVDGALGAEDAAENDSFSENLLEHDHYTRPADFEGDPVPEILVSGNHAAIDRWRLEGSLLRTVLRRPDLLEDRTLDTAAVSILKKWCRDIEKIIKAQSLRGAGPSSGDG